MIRQLARYVVPVTLLAATVSVATLAQAQIVISSDTTISSGNVYQYLYLPGGYLGDVPVSSIEVQSGTTTISDAMLYVSGGFSYPESRPRVVVDSGATVNATNAWFAGYPTYYSGQYDYHGGFEVLSGGTANFSSSNQFYGTLDVKGTASLSGSANFISSNNVNGGTPTAYITASGTLAVSNASVYGSITASGNVTISNTTFNDATDYSYQYGYGNYPNGTVTVNDGTAQITNTTLPRLAVRGGTASVDGGSIQNIDLQSGTLNLSHLELKQFDRPYSGMGTLNLNAGVTGSAAITSYNTVNVNAGATIATLQSEQGMVHIAGGSVNRLDSNSGNFGNYITPQNIVVTSGSVNDINLAPQSSLIVSGGTVGTVFAERSTVEITGGAMTGAILSYNYGNQLGYDAAHLRVSGGSFGTLPFDGDNFILGHGNVAFYGTNLVSTLIGTEYGVTRYHVSGTLFDGTSVTDLGIGLYDGGSISLFNGGATEATALLPVNTVTDPGAPPVYTFGESPSGAWFDPTPVDAFTFAMVNMGDAFTQATLPSGFNAPFSVAVNGATIGSFTGGQTVRFADYGFSSGVPNFVIYGIDPKVDADDPNAFPVQLSFTQPFASFTMTGGGAPVVVVPEAGTGWLALCGVVAFAAVAKRQKARA